MRSIERVSPTRHPAPTLAGRLAGAVVAAGLVAVGVGLAIRPVGNEGLGTQPTIPGWGTVVSAQTTWGGTEFITVDWDAVSEQQSFARFEVDINSAPAYHVGDVFACCRGYPGTVAVGLSGDVSTELRWDAVFQSVMVFILAGLASALTVIWPAGQFLFGDQARRARRCLRRYLLTPIGIVGVVVAGFVVVQDQPLSAFSADAGVLQNWLSAPLLLLLIWPCVRAVRFYQLRRLLTVADDAADNAAPVTSVAGRRLQLGEIRMVALAGQSPAEFNVGDRVRRYGRWSSRGPALITDGDKLLIGFASRPVVQPAAAAIGAQPEEKA